MLNNMNDHTPFGFTVQFLDGQFDNPYAGGQNFNVFPFAGDFDPKTPYHLPLQVDVLEHQFKLPYTQNWNLTVERKLAADWWLRVGYVGTSTAHPMIGVDQNAPIYNFNQPLSQNQNTIDQRRPRPEYENIYTMAIPLDQQYNGLDVLINKQFSHGLRTNRFD